jgi:hypothetical protein
MNGKIIAVVVVAVMAVAAVGAGIILANNNNSKDKTDIDSPVLLVYGNANGDYYLNNSDVSELKKLVKDQPSDWKEKHPYADTNCDGSLTDDDVSMLESILNATADEKVTINVVSHALEVPYVSKVRYPVTAAACNSNQTTMATLKTIGIDKEIVSTSVASSGTNTDGSVKQSNYDKYVFGDYFDVMDSKHQIGAKSAEIAADKMTQVVKNYGCTVYFYSASNGKFANTDELSKGIDIVQVEDGMSNVAHYGSAVLLYGFLFGNDDNKYVDKSVEVVNWFLDFSKELKNRLSKVTSGEVTKVSGVASSMTGYVSIKGSSNTNIIEEAGLYCPLANKNPTSETSMTMTYNSASDTWLNMIDVDTIVVLEGSKSGWSWFDGDYTASKLPSSYKTHFDCFNTMKCYKDGKMVLVSTMMCGPQKSGVLAQYYYPDLFEEKWFENKMADFYQKFWGFESSQTDNLKYILSQSEAIVTA